MLEVYAKEFVGIGTYLKKRGMERNGYIRIEKNNLEELLNKNAFDTSENKLRLWKSMKWIDTEDRRVTKRAYDKESHSYKPYVLMDAEILKKMSQVVRK